MGEASIDITVGGISFSGKGEPKWLGEQLDKILEAVPDAAATQVDQPEREIPASDVEPEGGGAGFAKTLTSHIKAKGGESNQRLRFLATADWLRLRGEKELTTAKVAKALSEQHQKRLGNASDCLNKNVRNGLCEKKNQGFFITPDGLTALGHTS